MRNGIILFANKIVFDLSEVNDKVFHSRESQVIKTEIHIYKFSKLFASRQRLCLNSVDIEAKSLTNLLVYSENNLRRKEKCSKVKD